MEYALPTEKPLQGENFTKAQHNKEKALVTDYAFDLDKTRSFSWTSYNKPRHITSGDTTLTFHYGANRSRMRQYNSNTATTITYINPVSEYHESPTERYYQYTLQIAGKAVLIQRHYSTEDPETTYLHHDHLGSIIAISDHTGTVVEQRNYDAFGKQRATPGLTALPSLTRSLYTCGYTGHEALDDVGLIHMNGRVYDATVGRFISADPFVQDPKNSQNYNRYSYVLNNPLTYTDPSGFFFDTLFDWVGKLVDTLKRTIRRVFRVIRRSIRTIAAIASAAVIAPTCVPCAGFVAGMIASGGDFKAGLIGAFTAGAFDIAGTVLSKAHYLTQVAAHGTIGGISSQLAGGKFIHGFLSAGVTKGLGQTKAFKDFATNRTKATIASAVTGGTAAVLGGGKFRSGAITGSFSYLFNDAMHEREKGVCSAKGRCIGNSEREVYRRTDSEPRVAWEGTENIDWQEVSIEGAAELFIKRPLPPLSIRTGIEHGYYEYEHQVGYQEYQYIVEGLGITDLTPIGGPVWTDATVWRRSPYDQNAFTRGRYQLCVMGSCGPE